jgi:cyclopropane fatty-acyl-phospholipid synthase-like methyltransferase
VSVGKFRQGKGMVLARLKSAISRLFPKDADLASAQHYVCTDEVSGRTQFDLLIKSGLQPKSTLLEIGCGCLNAGAFLIKYLDEGRYVGIDPNPWLREAALKSSKVRRLVARKAARFLSNDTFDASELGRKYDYIFSHSVLSHAAHFQLEQYLRNAAKVLASGGTILSSIRLAEGNKWGSAGSDDHKDTMDKEWVYPGVSFFTAATIQGAAAKCGLSVEIKPEYTEYYVAHRPAEFHDWVIFKFTPSPSFVHD